MKKEILLSFADFLCPISKKDKKCFFIQMGTLIDWGLIINKHYSRGTSAEIEVRRNYSSSIDQDASWLKKRSKLHYGYKKHYVTDEEGLVLGVLTTSANKNEVTNLEEVLSTVNLESGTSVKADKGYKSKKNDANFIIILVGILFRVLPILNGGCFFQGI